MRMVLSISLHRSLFSCSCSDFKRWCWGDRSRTSLALIVHRSAAHLATSPYVPLVASSNARVGDLAMVLLGYPRPVVAPWETPAPEEPSPESQEAPVLEMPGADGASLGAASVEVDGASPQPRDDIGSLLRDFMMCGADIGVPGSTAPGDAAPAPRPSGIVGLGVSELLLPGSPAFHPRLSTGGGWRRTRSSCVHRSSPRRGCCMRCCIDRPEHPASDSG
jgi:hypothetical protein